MNKYVIMKINHFEEFSNIKSFIPISDNETLWIVSNNYSYLFFNDKTLFLKKHKKILK